VLLRWVPVVLVLALFGSAFAIVEWNLDERWLGLERADPEDNPAAVAPPTGLVLPTPSAAPLLATPVVSGPADPAAVRRALAPLLDDPDLGDHVVAMVGSAGSSAPVFSTGSGAVTPASSLKLVTSTAALAALGPATTFTTSVVAGPTPRDIVLVGGGDPFLASKPDATGSAYPHRADLATLARRTAAALREAGVRTVRVGYDDSLFTGPRLSSHWPDDYVTDSVVTPISALWVDHGLLEDGLQRATDPSAQAADVFARALARAGIKPSGTPTHRRAAAGATRLASVESAPLDQIVQEVLEVSDNEGAEVLLRQTGLAVEGVGSFTAGVDAVERTLEGLGVHFGSGTTLYDGSGLSRDDRLPVRTLLDVLTLASDDGHPELRAVVEGLPVAAFSGSLEERFGDGARGGRGWVRAKTGTLTGISALAGLVQAADRTLLPFVIVADHVAPEDTEDARAALDRAASALATCRCGL